MGGLVNGRRNRYDMQDLVRTEIERVLAPSFRGLGLVGIKDQGQGQGQGQGVCDTPVTKGSCTFKENKLQPAFLSCPSTKRRSYRI